MPPSLVTALPSLQPVADFVRLMPDLAITTEQAIVEVRFFFRVPAVRSLQYRVGLLRYHSHIRSSASGFAFLHYRVCDTDE